MLNLCWNKPTSFPNNNRDSASYRFQVSEILRGRRCDIYKHAFVPPFVSYAYSDEPSILRKCILQTNAGLLAIHQRCALIRIPAPQMRHEFWLQESSVHIR